MYSFYRFDSLGRAGNDLDRIEDGYEVDDNREPTISRSRRSIHRQLRYAGRAVPIPQAAAVG